MIDYSRENEREGVGALFDTDLLFLNRLIN